MTLERETPPVEAAALAPILEDLGADPTRLHDGADAAPGRPGRSGRSGHHWLAVAPGARPERASLPDLEAHLADDGVLLLGVPGRPDERALAAWRNALWPEVHVFALYTPDSGGAGGAGGITRRTLQGSTRLDASLDFEGTILAGRRRAHVMSPSATVEKFDANAKGWDGVPGSPGYGHFRWMRRYVARFGAPRVARRILDFGCGAGWVGIEATRSHPGSALCAFDPSPEMVKIAEANAQSSGIADFTGRTGFGEDPPFPRDGEQPFDWVLSSGVLSFSPDLERWMDGVAAAVAPGGTLTIGDIHRDSRGFRRRRNEKPLLPVRELNARTREEIRPMLEARGFEYRASSSYQLTRPVPEAMHVSEQKLGGLLNPPLLWLNRLASFADSRLGSPLPDQFDSWVAHFVRADQGSV